MGFQIARKHAARLRLFVLLAAFPVPAWTLLPGLLAGDVIRTFLFALAAVLATVGVLTGRWLFFAEAKHTVTLHFGAMRA